MKTFQRAGAFVASLLFLVIAIQPSAQGSKGIISQRKVYEATKVKAYNEIRGAANEGSSANFTINYDISDAFPKDLRKLYVSQVEYSSKLFATFFPKNEVMNIYLYSEIEENKIKSDPILGRYFVDLG